MSCFVGILMALYAIILAVPNCHGGCKSVVVVVIAIGGMAYRKRFTQISFGGGEGCGGLAQTGRRASDVRQAWKESEDRPWHERIQTLLGAGGLGASLVGMNNARKRDAD